MQSAIPLKFLDFDADWYLVSNPDVQASGMDPWEHYRTIGGKEGRLGAPVQALKLDHMLWRGFSDIALPALHNLIAIGPAHETAVAGWVLARWLYDRCAPEDAYNAIEIFHDHPEGQQIISHPGPALLAIHLSLITGRVERAAHHLKNARDQHPAHADLDLATLCLTRAKGGDHTTLEAHLAALYKGTTLSTVALSDGKASLFDRLTSHATPPVPDGPLISVIMPVFNGATGIDHALDGLCAQSWHNLEIIIVDDGSTDDTATIIHNRAASDSRIRIIETGQNQGAYPARNAGMAAATGDFITVHDADDWSHPQKLEAQLTPLLDDDSLMGSLSHWVRVSEDIDMSAWRIDHGWVHRNVSSLMIRSSVRDTLGYWDRTRANADTEYYYRIMRAFGPASLHEVHPGLPLAFGRTSTRSLTGQTATHLRTQFHGLRRNYMDAAFNWHRQAATPDDLYMPEKPDQRPFRIPAQIGVGDLDGPDTAYDILTRSDLFDPHWYWLAHADVLAADIDPVRHYLEGGAAEDRDTGPHFATGAYKIAHNLPDETVPLLHWHETGADAGHDPLPRFDGALKDAPPEQPRVMVFGHAAGPTLFGAERSLIDVIARMVKRGLVPVVVLPSLRNRDYLARLLPITDHVQVLPQLPLNGWHLPDPETVSRVRALIRDIAPQQIHVNTLVQDIPLVAARAEGVESILHIREMPHEDAALCRTLSITPERLRTQILERADRFVVNSPILAQWLDAPDRTQIRPNTVNTDLFYLAHHPGDPLNVALISSNILKKGVADFIKIAHEVKQSGRPIRFLLIGPPTRDLHLLRPWPDNIEFRGYSASPVEAIAQADIVLSLSHFTESFGRTVMEAMAAARPVITYDRGTPAVLVKSGETGFVVPADDTGCVARAILAFEAARGQMVAMGRAGQTRARALQALAETDT